MEVLSIYRNKFNSKRDILNFIDIRDSKINDDEELGNLLVETFRETNAEKNVSSIMNCEREYELRNTKLRRENALVRVVELGNKLVGSYTLSMPESKTHDSWNKHSCYLSTVAVHRVLHGLGIGRMLVLEAIMKSLETPSKHLTLYVEKNAPRLQSFYKSFGFYHDPLGDQTSCGMDLLGNTCDLCFIKANNLLKAI